MKLITASSSELAGRCLAPFTDEAVWDESKPGSWAMRIGSGAHYGVECYLGDVGTSIDAIADKFNLTRRQCEVVERSIGHAIEYIEANGLREIEPEQKFCISRDLKTAKAIGSGSDRDYSQAGDALAACTIDGFGIVNGRALLMELKVGRGWYPHPSRMPQIRTQTLLAAKAHGVDEVHATLLQVNEDGADGRVHVFDMFDLLEIESDVARWATGSKEPSPGDWCGRCKVSGCKVRQEKKQRAA